MSGAFAAMSSLFDYFSWLIRQSPDAAHQSKLLAISQPILLRTLNLNFIGIPPI
jgi:hypothetical protein